MDTSGPILSPLCGYVERRSPKHRKRTPWLGVVLLVVVCVAVVLVTPYL